MYLCSAFAKIRVCLLLDLSYIQIDAHVCTYTCILIYAHMHIHVLVPAGEPATRHPKVTCDILENTFCIKRTHSVLREHILPAGGAGGRRPKETPPARILRAEAPAAL